MNIHQEHLKNDIARKTFLQTLRMINDDTLIGALDGLSESELIRVSNMVQEVFIQRLKDAANLVEGILDSNGDPVYMVSLEGDGIDLQDPYFTYGGDSDD